jgi:hypothetical protein
MNILFLLLSAFNVTTSFAADEYCSVGFGDYGALRFSLPTKKELFRTLDQKQAAKNNVKEVAILKNGVRVEITQAGCSHHTTSVKFSNLKSDTDHGALKQAVQLLSELPAEKGSQILLISDEIKKANENAVKNESDFRCGDGTCSLKIGNGSLEITYDFAV